MTDAPKELDWDDVEQVDLIGLEIGYGLIPLVNPETGGQLMTRVKGVRKKLSSELGFLVSPVRIRDVLSLEPDSYHIVLHGVVRARGSVKPSRELAINPGSVYGKLEGVATREPAFGLEAVWIDPSQRDMARTLGYTVVDAATAIATHMNKVLRDNAHELLSHDETQKLLDKLAARHPKLVEELVPGKMPLGVVTRTLQNLLAEGVPIRDMRTLAEALLEAGARTQGLTITNVGAAAAVKVDDVWLWPVPATRAQLAAQVWQERLAHRSKGPLLFGLLCAVNLALGISFNHFCQGAFKTLDQKGW